MRIPIENCKFEFALQCPKEWDKLAVTDDPLVRTCEACEKNVHYCDTVQLAKHLAGKGCCVALDPDADTYESDYNYPTSKRPPRLGIGKR